MNNIYVEKPPINECLAHIGVGHLDGGHSGRYPWGSGKEPYQNAADFNTRIKQLHDLKYTYTDPKTGETFTGNAAIAKGIFGITTKELRIQIGLAESEEREDKYQKAIDLKEKGWSNVAIAKELGLKNESSVRSLLDEDSYTKMMQAKNTADVLKKIVAEKGPVDVGSNVELELGVSREKLDAALYLLEQEGYNVYKGGVPNATNPGKQINLQGLYPPGAEYKDLYDFQLSSVVDYTSADNGKTFDPTFVKPVSMDGDRVYVRLLDEVDPATGFLSQDKDGVLEIRPGVKDLDLGEGVNYAQVRVLVDGDKYIKGMAVYSDNVPEGYDCVFNSNKTSRDKAFKTAKEITEDNDNPFGSLIKQGVIDPDNPEIKSGGQHYYYDEDGKKKLSLINKKSDQGDWDEWKDTLSAQFLSKQPEKLIKQQLDMTLADKKVELERIMSLENPVLRKSELLAFADGLDSDAAHLKAEALPKQSFHVILPVNSLKDGECFAPNYENGTKLALIRYPHAGTFEIPVLTVNNSNAEGKKMIGKNSFDAIGIKKNAAEQLSGADFDGDTVMAIPITSKSNISHRSPLADLAGFDPTMTYGGECKIGADGKEHYYRHGKEYRLMSKASTQNEMGKATNLIMDMTLLGADDKEMAKAVKYSMVVIDAEKHKLDYHSAYVDNDIRALKLKYQGTLDPDTGKVSTGAATVITRAKSPTRIDKREGQYKIDPDTGEKIWKTASDKKLLYTTQKINKKTGEVVEETHHRQEEVPLMDITKDATTLISKYRHPKEIIYANYANNLKEMANYARKTVLTIKNDPINKESAKKYKAEVDSLDEKLLAAQKNAPKERLVHICAKRDLNSRIADNPILKDDKKTKKKLSQQLVSKYREIFGAHKKKIVLTDNEWKAIQSNAIGSTKLKKIFDNCDTESLYSHALPRKSKFSATQIAAMKAKKAAGFDLSAIAEQFGCSPSTVSKYINS